LRHGKKGENGRLLVIGGSAQYPGAVYLAAIAALRLGVDLVKIAAPKKAAWAVNSLCPDVITVKLNGDYISLKHIKELTSLIDWCDVFLIGNGMGTRRSTAALVRKLAAVPKPKVIDADAIKAVGIQDCRNSILTPHAGEYKILQENSPKWLLGDNVVLLKGPSDMIFSNKRKQTVKGGNNAMTVGGTGDVLAGLCAGYAASGQSLWQAACMGSRLNKSIGDSLFKKLGPGLIASDFLPNIAVKAKALNKNLCRK